MSAEQVAAAKQRYLSDQIDENELETQLELALHGNLELTPSELGLTEPEMGYF